MLGETTAATVAATAAIENASASSARSAKKVERVSVLTWVTAEVVRRPGHGIGRAYQPQRQQARQYPDAMPSPSDVLACVDLSPASEVVVGEAARLARGLRADLHILHAAGPEPDFVGYDDPGGPSDRDHRAGELRGEHSRLGELAGAAEGDGLDVTPLLVMGPTVEVIIDEAERRRSALIVVGSHGHGALHRLLVGSTTDKLLRTSERPVLVVPVIDRAR